MIDFILLLVLLLISFSLGEWLLKVLKFESDMFLEKFCFAVGIGLGILSYTVFFLAVFGLLYAQAARLLIVLLFLLSFKNIKVIFRNLSLELGEIKKAKTEKAFFIFLLLLALHLFLTLLYASAPVTNLDSQYYHLEVPKVYIEHHGIVDMPSGIFSSFPSVSEMLYALALLLHGDILASLIQWLMSVMLVFALFIFGKNFFSAKIGVLSSVMFFCTPVVIFFSVCPMVDIGLAFFVFLSIYGLISWFVSGRRAMFILSAITAGIAAGIKYNGLFSLLILSNSVWLGLIFVKKETWPRAIKDTLIYGGIALLIVAPWLIKNMIYVGNPVYPFLFNIFGGRRLPSSIFYTMYTYRPAQFLSYLLFPWKITMGEVPSWHEYIGPLYLAFVLPIFFLRKINGIIKYLIIYFLSGMTFLYFFSGSTRYMTIFFVALVVVAAYVVEKLRDSDTWLKKALPVFIIFSIFVNLTILAAAVYTALPVVFGLESRDQYLSKKIRTYNVIQYINKNLEPDAKILFFDPRMYYCQKETVDVWIAYLQEAKSAEDVLKKYRELNLTHILVNDAEWFRQLYWQGPHKELAPEHLKLVYEKNKVYLYKIVY